MALSIRKSLQSFSSRYVWVGRLQTQGTKDDTFVCGDFCSLKILSFRFSFLFQISQTYYLDGVSRKSKGQPWGERWTFRALYWACRAPWWLAALSSYAYVPGIYKPAVVHCKASCCIESAFFTKRHSTIKRIYSHYNFALLSIEFPIFDWEAFTRALDITHFIVPARHHARLRRRRAKQDGEGMGYCDALFRTEAKENIRVDRCRAQYCHQRGDGDAGDCLRVCARMYQVRTIQVR